MAKMKKVEVIAKLKKLGVEVETDNYKELCQLLRDTTGKQTGVVHLEETTGSIDVPKALYDRARKIGWTDEQIAAFSDHTSLQMACQRVKPQATAQAEPKPKRKPQPSMKGEPASISFTSEISETRAVHVSRVTYDEMQMNDFIRKQRINLRSIQKVTLERDFVPVRGQLITEMCIDYVK